MNETTVANRTPHLAIVGWLVFVLLVVYTVLIGGGFAGIYVVQLRTASLVLAAVGRGFWVLLSLFVP